MNELDTQLRFVSIKYFWQTMLGVSSKTWFYDHLGDEGFPQPVDVGGRKMLVHAECVAYMERLMARREGGKKNPQVKRRVGRPASLPPRLRTGN